MQGFSQKLASLNSDKIKLAKTQSPASMQPDRARSAPAKPDSVKPDSVKPGSVEPGTEQSMALKTAAITPVTKLCYIKPANQFSRKIKPISYPCNNKHLKRQAQKTVNNQTSQQKLALQNEQRRIKDREELRLAKIENQRLQKINTEIEIEAKQRELKWKKMKTSLWVGRCIKHWNKGTSPCYCQPYLERAPKNTKDTCKKKEL